MALFVPTKLAVLPGTVNSKYFVPATEFVTLKNADAEK
jgi:hypothetical protein